MTWAEIARKEFYDAVRARTLQALIGLFLVLVVGVSLLLSRVEVLGGEQLTVETLIGWLTGVGVLLPIIAILLGYKSISGQREDGRLHLTLTLPHTRGDVIAGTFVGRGVVLLLPLVVGFGFGLAVALATFDAVSVPTYLRFLLLISLLSLSYLGLAVGVSAALESTTVGAGLLFGLYLVTQFAWDYLVLVVVWAISEDLAQTLSEGLPVWLQYGYLLNPDTAFSYVYNESIVGGETTLWFFPVQLDAVFTGFGVVVLVAWIVVPLAVGYAVLEGSDL